MNSPNVPVFNMDELYMYATCPKWYFLSRTPGLVDINKQFLAGLNFRRELFKLVLQGEMDGDTKKSKEKFQIDIRKLYAKYFYKITPQGLTFTDELKISQSISCFKNLIIRFKEYNFTIGRKIVIPYSVDNRHLCDLELDPIAIFTNTGRYIRYVFAVEDNEWCMTSIGRRLEHSVALLAHEIAEDKARIDVFYTNPNTLDLCKIKYNIKSEKTRLYALLKNLTLATSYKTYLGGVCHKCPYGDTCRPWEQVEILDRLGKIT